MSKWRRPSPLSFYYWRNLTSEKRRREKHSCYYEATGLRFLSRAVDPFYTMIICHRSPLQPPQPPTTSRPPPAAHHHHHLHHHTQTHISFFSCEKCTSQMSCSHIYVNNPATFLPIQFWLWSWRALAVFAGKLVALHAPFLAQRWGSAGGCTGGLWNTCLE